MTEAVASDDEIAASIGFTAEQLDDPWFRICNLYTVEDENGVVQRFVPNAEQEYLYRNLHYLVVILKARQLGMTTFIAILALDQAIFVSNFKAGFIANTLNDAKTLFASKLSDVYARLPVEIKAANPLVNDSKSEMKFRNGSSIQVGTSLRGQTLQFLHVSEFGKISTDPARAREIVTGSFNTVHAGNWIFVESTSEGASGAFFDLVKAARALSEAKTALTELDWKFFFFPWWRKAEYAMSPEEADRVVVSPDMRKYFDDLERTVFVEPGVPLRLSIEQRAWYVKKKEALLDAPLSEEKGRRSRGDMKREFPSTADEAFEVVISGGWYADQLTLVRSRGQIGRYPYVPAIAVNSFWDLGHSKGNAMAVWFQQRVNNRDRLIHYHEAEGEDLSYWARYCQQTLFIFDTHWFPHDGDHMLQGESFETKAEIFRRLRPNENVDIVPRVAHVTDGIELLRGLLPELDFDEEECLEGLKALANYTKVWNASLGQYSSMPLHNWASNGADALRQMAQAYYLVKGRPGKSVALAPGQSRTSSSRRGRAIAPGSWKSV